jgi:hypothetical protein
MDLSLVLSFLRAGGTAAGEPPQFTADWGNINTIDDFQPTIFWAGPSGAVRNIGSATAITFSDVGTITVTLSIAGTGGVTSMRYDKNGVTSTYSTPFTMTNGDVLKIGLVGPATSPISGSGEITITNTTEGGYAIDKIPYAVNIE